MNEIPAWFKPSEGWKWTAPQAEALHDYQKGEYLDMGETPNAPHLRRPLNLQQFGKSFCVSGAVGVGKTTLISKAMGSAPLIHSARYIRVFRFPSVDILCVSDFSAFISQYLRDLTPSSHYHAGWFYANAYAEIWHYSQIATRRWHILWDRFALENIVFARDPATVPSLIFSEFWPSKTALRGLHSLRPVFVVWPVWLKKGEFDWSMRTNNILQRRRREFEVEHADEDAMWFYESAFQLYKDANWYFYDMNAMKKPEHSLRCLLDMRFFSVELCESYD